ncbi:hypothetical protein H5410_001041 [Solanum commersonii]|uniref:Uncharacterized protein n=1 Tax=Solanum commersonii TaxID=4109 RepID=A0A9J6AXZ7_SOLCO|nr:hypothetical protein H5410_001041 [Solanum commersonii]
MSLKKNNKDLAKYPLCVIVFVKDCELTDKNLNEDGVEICGIDGVMVDEVYGDKGTLKAVMMQYAIDHRF